MSKKIDAAALTPIIGTMYPPPYDEPCLARSRTKLGDAAGLTQFGVNLLRLPPGAWSSQRHWQTASDEFVYVLAGDVTLVTNSGTELLRPGDCAGFKAGDPDGHCLQNRSAADAIILEIGTRVPGDAAHYSEADMFAPPGGKPAMYALHGHQAAGQELSLVPRVASRGLSSQSPHRFGTRISRLPARSGSASKRQSHLSRKVFTCNYSALRLSSIAATWAVIPGPMQYTGEISRIQQAASRTADYAARRAATFEGLAPRAGEHILEVGCGSGLFIKQVAEAVGPSGRAHAVDVSEDQIAAARSTCAGLSAVELRVASALELPFPMESFDAVASIQVLEYIDDIDGTLRELRRVLKPSGRFVNFATNWDAVFWNSRSADRERQILDGWRKHAPFPNLPAVLRPCLLAAGFAVVQQSPVSILNTTYDSDTYSYWLARLVAAFVVERQLVAPETAAAWLDDLADAVERDEYMFCSMAVVTCAVAS